MKVKVSSDIKVKPTIGKYYLLFLSIIIIMILISYFVILRVNPTEYTQYLLGLKSSVMNEKLMNLKNANTLYNLPNITLQTNNADIENLINCKNALKYLGPYDANANLSNYRNVCKNTCGGSGQLLIVENENDYVYNNKFVDPGVYCTVEPTPCNLNTGYAIATVNSIKCQSKYPRMFGGPNASTIIACNDEKYPSTGSVLWDYANGEEVDPATINMTHEDEILPDGSFRFRCKYNESENKNPYIPHPLDRFHPITDKCNNTIYAADYSVHAVVDELGWVCDCGDFNTTRVKHLDESNPQSICTNCYRETDGTNYKMPYICFKEDSSYDLPKNYQPCIEYLSKGNFCSQLTIEATPSTSDNFFTYTKVSNINNLSTRYQVYKN